MTIGLIIAVVVFALLNIVSFRLGIAYRQRIAEAEIGSAEGKAKSIIEEATKDGEAKKRELMLEAKEENQKLRTEAEKEIKERRAEVSRQERRINQKEENLDKKTEALEKKEAQLSQKLKEIEHKNEEITEIKAQQMAELEKISGMTRDEAKTILMQDIENQTRHDAAIMVKEIEQQAKENAEAMAKNIVALSIQKVAADHVAETTVSVVNLPNYEMK